MFDSTDIFNLKARQHFLDLYKKFNEISQFSQKELEEHYKLAFYVVIVPIQATIFIPGIIFAFASLITHLSLSIMLGGINAFLQFVVTRGQASDLLEINESSKLYTDERMHAEALHWIDSLMELKEEDKNYLLNQLASILNDKDKFLDVARIIINQKNLQEKLKLYIRNLDENQLQSINSYQELANFIENKREFLIEKEELYSNLPQFKLKLKKNMHFALYTGWHLTRLRLTLEAYKKELTSPFPKNNTLLFIGSLLRRIIQFILFIPALLIEITTQCVIALDYAIKIGIAICILLTIGLLDALLFIPIKLNLLKRPETTQATASNLKEIIQIAVDNYLKADTFTQLRDYLPDLDPENIINTTAPTEAEISPMPLVDAQPIQNRTNHFTDNIIEATPINFPF